MRKSARFATTTVTLATLFAGAGMLPAAAGAADADTIKMVFTAFLLSGGLAGLAGFIFLARFGNISVLAGIGHGRGVGSCLAGKRGGPGDHEIVAAA